jgi:RND family efflux transporter MFP subunit
MRNRSTDLKYQIGDQVWAGQPILELPDLDELKAEVLINEVDIAKITPGMKVEIRPDAFSDSTYMGEVIKVANLAVNKTRNSKIKVFPVEVRILSKTSKLMPGLSVSCRLLVKDYPNATFVPLQAVFNDEEGSYVYVRSGNHFKRQNIETGISNTDFIVVEKGLEAGETVALVDPVRLEEAQKKEKANQKETK